MKMKILLTGGPLDGEITDVRKNVFALEHTETEYECGRPIRETKDRYERTRESRKHPCKKRGTVPVWRHVGHVDNTRRRLAESKRAKGEEQCEACNRWHKLESMRSDAECHWFCPKCIKAMEAK
jgi:hypothetical protein